ncbi:hypothetical protein [Aeromicrobium duanguangcaii]|uniref:Uncharacterized protein n=1 Tax=Aeromicrobium duanguangcaii TaxID=2968086 RepID=A0ABY5KHQ8_9ACTN|nr:hypothetical protein [Aeromicrobium duanguangcaii]MCD9153537.1 hypothetical protein [Aeromicrobium duanguangcaii]UUI69375.1 hypothetical protein NP095_04550 [Aeromicrobium duanguangcaii]
MTSGTPSRRRRRVAAWGVAVAALVLVLLGGHAVLAGPLRDSDVARLAFGDPSREDALTGCAEWIAEERGTTAPADLSAVTTSFGTDPLRWEVDGFATTGGDPEPFACTLAWFPRPAVIYRTSLDLHDGLRFGLEGPASTTEDPRAQSESRTTGSSQARAHAAMRARISRPNSH